MIAELFNHFVEAVFAPLEGNISTVAPAGFLLLGLITGLRHSLEADHIAAVSTIMAASQSHKKLRHAPLLGALWGLGHTASLFAAGLVVLLLAVSIPQKVSSTLEFGVGVMLVFLGATTLTGFNIGKFVPGIFSRHTHEHLHVHEDTGVVHSHEHDHHDHRHGHKSLAVGMVHGGKWGADDIGSIDYQLCPAWAGIHRDLWCRFGCQHGCNEHANGAPVFQGKTSQA